MAINSEEITKILREAMEKGATEVHFKVPNRPLFRIDGSLLPTNHQRLMPQDTHHVANALCQLSNIELPLAQVTDWEFSFGLHGVGRFHASLYRQRGSIAVIVQRVALEIPSLASLGFGPEIEKVLGEPGLVLLAGTWKRVGLLAALVDRFNAQNRGHVVALEDPLTYLHRDAMAAISQRGIGTDVPDFPSGIRMAIRQRANLLAVSNIADMETAEAVLRAAEYGLPVLATVAAPNAASAFSWVTRHYSVERRTEIEERLKNVLVGILSTPAEAATEFVTLAK